MIGIRKARKAMEDVEDGTVFCAREQDRIDVERCYSCPLQHRLARAADGHVVGVACSFDDWDGSGLLAR